jgi:cobalt-zinc-cadmium efflux system protein
VGHAEHAHSHHPRAAADARALRLALILIVSFMTVEIVCGLLASSLALLSDAAHMLTDAAALAISLLAAQLARRPAVGSMTYGLGRAEILSAQANGLTMMVLGGLIVYGAIARLISPPDVRGGLVLAVALVGIALNLLLVRLLNGGGSLRSLNVEGSYRHIITDLYGFIATAVAAVVILTTGFVRADPIASLLIAALMLTGGYSLLRASIRVVMEAAPEGVDPDVVGNALAQQHGVVEVHDLHVWEVTSGFPALSAHVIVDANCDCHDLRRTLSRMLADRFGIAHSTLQVEHARAEQPPIQIEASGERSPGASPPPERGPSSPRAATRGAPAARPNVQTSQSGSTPPR